MGQSRSPLRTHISSNSHQEHTPLSPERDFGERVVRKGTCVVPKKADQQRMTVSMTIRPASVHPHFRVLRRDRPPSANSVRRARLVGCVFVCLFVCFPLSHPSPDQTFCPEHEVLSLGPVGTPQTPADTRARPPHKGVEVGVSRTPSGCTHMARPDARVSKPRLRELPFQLQYHTGPLARPAQRPRALPPTPGVTAR